MLLLEGMEHLLERLLKPKHRGYFLKYLTLIHEIEVKTIAEIGVFRGKNAKVLREEFPKAHLYLIDPWKPTSPYLHSKSAVSRDPQIFIEAKAHVEALFQEDPLTTLIARESQEALSLLPEKLDLVFLDANHAYEALKEEIVRWLKRVRPGGILAGHNYGRPRLPGVAQAVSELLPSFYLGQDEVWYTFADESRSPFCLDLE